MGHMSQPGRDVRRRSLPAGLTWLQLAVVGLAVLGLVQVAAEANGFDGAQPVILTLSGTVPLALLSRQPIAALITILVAYLFSFDGSGHPTVAVMIAAVVAAWLAGRHGRPLHAGLAVAPAVL